MPDKFIEALRAGNAAAVKSLLATNPALASKAQYVTEAGRLGDLQFMKLLKSAGADLNALFRGYRAMHALIQEKPHGGETDASADRLACLAWMLQNGADPELPAAWPPSRAILVAAFQGSEEFVHLLKKHGAKIDGFVHCALGDMTAVRKIIKKDPGFVTARDQGVITGLHCACASRMDSKDAKIRKNLHEIITLLLDAGADPNLKVKGWSHELDAAYFITNTGDLERFRILLDAGANATEAIRSALWNAPSEFWELALERGARFDVVAPGALPILNDLIRWGQFTPATWMLQKGADPNIPDERGFTAVHQAASRQNVNILKSVLAAGGDPERKNKDGQTPRMLAKPEIWRRATAK